jgi:SAM-dependent methyltransferase
MSTCALCLEPLDTAPIVGTKARGNRPSRRVACIKCGLVQANPQPSQAELDAYYSSGEFWKDHQTSGLVVFRGGREHFVAPGSPEYDATIEMMHRQRAQRLIEDLGLQPGARVLEIGCAAGLTLAELQKLGMRAVGIDPDGAMVARSCARLDHRCAIQASLADMDGDSGRLARQMWLGDSAGFDAVIAYHVLEHFTDPLVALGQMRSLLKPGGRVYLEVPNVAEPGLPLCEHWMWVHTFDFERHTLAAFLKRAGFDDVVAVDVGNLPSRPNRLLHAWATNGNAEPRAYEDHDGPRGEQIAAYLCAMEAMADAPQAPTLSNAPRAPELYRLRASAPPYDAARYNGLRDEVAAYDTSVARIANAQHQGADALGLLTMSWDEDACALLESHHHEEWAHFYALGEGMALLRAKAQAAHLANAMRLAELLDGKGEE